MSTRNAVLALIAILFSSSLFSAENISADNLWTYDDDIFIPTLLDPEDPLSEAIYLPANIFIPTSDDPNATFPAIIFISSWALNEHEYASQAEKLSEKGYIVLSYTARGFHSSPGMISTAGLPDRFDASAAIDYLTDSPYIPVDPNAIGMSGISYGAGISLIAAMTDTRIKAVVAMSGWGDLVESLWAGGTANYAWLEILVSTSKTIPWLIKNVPDPQIEANYANMRNHENIAETKAWGAIRSPITYIENANTREEKPAIFISNNMHDYLFQPDSAIRFLSQYEGEWRLDLNRGTHASGEAGGLLGNEDHFVWTNLHLWFDHHLKGIENGINERKPFSTKILNTRNRESYSSLQAEDEVKVFNLVADSGALINLLSETSQNEATSEISFNTTEQVTYSGWVTGALNHTSRKTYMNEFNPANGMAFVTPMLEQPLRLRGEAKVNIQIIAEDKAQYFAYLFYLDPETGVANWVSHAPFTCHQSEGCALQEGELEIVTLDFYWTSVDFPAGSQVLLIIDGHDSDYWSYDTTPESNTVVFGPQHASTLSLPIVWDSPEYDNAVAEESDGSRSANGEGSATTGKGLGGSLPLQWLVILAGLAALRSRFRS